MCAALFSAPAAAVRFSLEDGGMSAVAHFLDEVVLTGSSADGPVQAWDLRTGMQLKAYK